MKKRPTTVSALKIGVAALALCLPAGNAWAAASCARPQDMTALQVAALQQKLVVVALSCHDAADYNRFVISHQHELQESDRALMDFFLRQDAVKGSDNYNAYKTGLANDASLRGARDPQFCRGAKAAFDDVLRHDGSVAELVSQRPSLARTGYVSCAPSARENTLMADATPNLPARHQAFPDGLPSDLAPNLTSRMDRVLPPISPHRDEGRVAPPRGNDSRLAQLHAMLDDRDAYNANGPDVDAADADDRGADQRDDFNRHSTGTRQARDDGDGPPDNYPNRDGYAYGPAANNAPSDDRDGYDAPEGNARYANGPQPYGPSADRPYAYRRYAYGPYGYRPLARPHYVRGPDGRWYVLLPGRR